MSGQPESASGGSANPLPEVLRGLLSPFHFERSSHVYLQLMAKLSLLAVLYPIMDDGWVGEWVWLIVFWLMMLGAVSVVADRAPIRRLALTLFWTAIGFRVLVELLEFGALGTVSSESWVWTAALVLSSAIYTTFFALIATVVLRDVFASGRVDTNRIVGSICFYVIIGLGFAYAYTLLEFASGGAAFRGQIAEGQGTLAELLYFSFVTLSTLGYGDITPRTDVARLLSVTEAMVGQVYLTVLVARLVGLHISQSVGSPKND